MQTTVIHSRAGNAIATLHKPIEHLQEVWARGEFFEQRLLEYIYWHYLGGVFVDVGSAIGNHSLFFAKFCAPQHVISVEPVRANVERQRELFKLNNVTVRIYNCALSDKPGTGAMEAFAGKNLGQWRLVKGDDVQVMTLDALLEGVDGRRITLVKVDVEGHELKVLQGGERTLIHNRPALFLEIRSRSQHKAITEYLARFGYAQVDSMFQDATVFEFTAT
jgi:FkbM family methyltransferase